MLTREVFHVEHGSASLHVASSDFANRDEVFHVEHLSTRRHLPREARSAVMFHVEHFLVCEKLGVGPL